MRESATETKRPRLGGGTVKSLKCTVLQFGAAQAALMVNPPGGEADGPTLASGVFPTMEPDAGPADDTPPWRGIREMTVHDRTRLIPKRHPQRTGLI